MRPHMEGLPVGGKEGCNVNIQWFPGHMAKTRKLIEENLRLVDVVVELLDSRIPASSKNPEIDGITKHKPKVLALNKSDLADELISEEWAKWYNENGYTAIFIDSLKGRGINSLKSILKNLMKDKTERDRQRGRIFRPIRIMVVGIPNVGKSSFINRISKRAGTVTGDKPGITKGKQWIRLDREIEMLDTPGILWPKFEDPETGINLAITGAIKDEVIDGAELALRLMEKLKIDYPGYIEKKYKLKDINRKTGYEILNEAGTGRGCIVSGGKVDINRISAIILDEFRGGRIGRISLERP